MLGGYFILPHPVLSTDAFACMLISGRICHRQLCRYCFYSRPNFGIFAPQGRHAAPSRWNLAGRRSAPPCQISPWSAQGWGFTAPKTEKMECAPKGQVPCTIFIKFTQFMCVLSLHNFPKFGCIISINDKIINKLLRWRCFQPNFRRPIAAKQWMGPKNVWDLKWWPWPPLSPCKIWWKLRDAHRRERTKCEVFHFVCFLKITLHGRWQLWCVVELLPQDIALEFVGRFRCSLQFFGGKEKPFLGNGTVFKILANALGNCQNLRKWVQGLCTPLRPFRS